LTHAAAYNDAHYFRAFPQGYEAHFWHRARLRIVQAELRKMAARRVIDVGCGPGAYVAALRADGLDCIGCDPGDITVPEELRPFVFGRTALDEVPDAVLAGVDTALLLDVLEHLAHPDEMLRRVRRRLPKLNAIIVTVPARQELWSELDRRAGHMRRYDRGALETVIAKAGFVVVESTYLFRPLYAPARLTRRRARSRAVTTPSRPWIHDLIARAMTADRRWLPSALPGTSLLCVAKPGGPEAEA
jgi:2-polyprenyl-3-methyl-5-hydroxy-6-metoxy-1,4-benzoquinol methylase